MEKKLMNDIIILTEPEKVDMADDWYEYANLDHFWIKARFDVLTSHLRSNVSGRRFFEIGCGSGLVINQFEKSLGAVVDGCDLNLHALKKITGVKGQIYCLNIYQPPQYLLKAYDGVLLMDVIEHIEDDVSFLRTSTSFAKEGGLVIINVPAFNLFFSNYDTEAGHKRRYDKKMMRALFERTGIEPLSITYWGFTLIPLIMLRKLMLKVMPQKKVIKSGFKPPGRFFNWLLHIMMVLENRVFLSPWAGTSLMAIGRIKQ